MQKKLFTELELSPELLKAVARVGYEEASPIQSEAIPVLLSGRDVIGQSQTGSGKTAAFSIPAIEKVDGSLRAPQVLILCPTRELAMQVAEEVSKLALFKRGVRELPIYGGQSYDRQIRGLREGAQIIIGTPGRVIDHLDRGTLKLDGLHTVILDEADRMLDMGFSEDIEKILSQAPTERQTVLFSATLPPGIRRLIERYTREPVNVRIQAQAMTVPAIEQIYYEVDRRSKLDVLCRIIDLNDIKFGIIFCATKMMVDELAEQLVARGYSADKLHGDITQSGRERVMAKYRKHAFDFLVATDVAARGLDIDDIEVVFNYDLPNDSEDYVHRIGRTGRAGRTGLAITFVAGREIYKLQNIMRFTKGRIRREKVPSAEEVEEKRANIFVETLRETLEKGEFKRHDAMIDRLLDQGHTPTDIASALIHLLNGDKPRPTEPEPAPASFSGPKGDYQKFRETRIDTRSEAPRKNSRDRKAEYRAAEQELRSNPATSHEEGMSRLLFSVGREHQIEPGDIVGVIAGVARIPKECIGAIQVAPRHSLVDITDEHTKLVLKKLNGIKFKGAKLQVRRAT